MGYYSSVAIGMKKEDGVRFLSDFAQGVRRTPLLENGFTMQQYPEYLVFAWNDVKWYSSAEDVQWVENYLKELCDAEKPVAFARVGEAIEDCEEWSCNDDDFDLLHNLFQISRTIRFVPTEKGGA